MDLTHKPQAGEDIHWIMPQTDEGLDILRHDTAHILAQALKELWGDKIAIAIGPTIQDGFYYDFLCQDPISEKDFPRIEKRMSRIVAQNMPIKRLLWSREQAIEFFQQQKEPFKTEIIESIPADTTLSFYQQGNFIDLCRGPHAPSTRFAGTHFKLLRIAGAYWRGDSNNVMMQRIYGTSWETAQDLEQYLTRIKEAKERDHRTIGSKADLFFLSNASRGSVFWQPDGWGVFRRIESFVRDRLNTQKYQEIKTPLFFDSQLWERSGHASKFADCMFTLKTAYRK